MFLDGKGNKAGAWEDAQFRKDAEDLSKFTLAGIRKVQLARPPTVFAGEVTVRCIIAGIVFSIAVLICKLPRRERKYLREYLVHKLDDALKDLCND